MLYEVITRSRGFVPRAVAIPEELPPVLAVGAELKNTVCLLRGDRAFVSPHIGDLQNVETYAACTAAIGQLRELLETTPVAVAHDLHPDYLRNNFV